MKPRKKATLMGGLLVIGHDVDDGKRLVLNAHLFVCMFAQSFDLGNERCCFIILASDDGVFNVHE